ncbi:MAG: hypothetical protein LBP55_09790 [Candidatus Adiutrix sp.]|nr:hypothetical protein [Candidatus Adiutrix sp.]
MRKYRVYLETTMFNYYFDSDRDGHVDTVRMFEAIGEGEYEGYTSGYVINKIKTKEMTALINAREGYRNIIICTPMEVLDNEEQ